MVLVVLIGVMAQTSYTYSSKAYEEPAPRVIASVSSESQTLPKEQMPDCVSSLNYLPSLTDSHTACFVQFDCSGEATSQPDLLVRHACSVADSGSITCDLSQGCLTVAEWKAYASEVCGC